MFTAEHLQSIFSQHCRPKIQIGIDRQEKVVPQSPHNRVAELHNLAAHAHAAADVSHDKEDHLSAHELTRKAHEHSTNVSRLVEELSAKKNTSTTGI